MAHTDQIPTAVLISISEQIAEAIQVTEDESFFVGESVTLKLGRTLAIWGIKPDALAALMRGVDPADLGDWTRSMEHWHHQIKFDTESRAFARSKASPGNPDEITLGEFGVSPEAEEIEAAITWVEQELQSNPEGHALSAPYDPLVRLLEIPSRRVTSLLLLDEAHNDTHLLIIEALPDNDTLKPRALLSSIDFLKGIAAQPFSPEII